jgi:hypothetical protein
MTWRSSFKVHTTCPAAEKAGPSLKLDRKTVSFVHRIFDVASYTSHVTEEMSETFIEAQHSPWACVPAEPSSDRSRYSTCAVTEQAATSLVVLLAMKSMLMFKFKTHVFSGFLGLGVCDRT